MLDLPRGVVTFLFTDIESSTEILARLGEGYGDVLLAHRSLVREAVAEHGGVVVDCRGDEFFCSFADAVGQGQSVLVSARPEDLALSEKSPADGLNVLAGKIAHRVFLGEVVDYLVDTGGAEIRVRTKPELDFRVGQPVHVSVAPHKCVGLAS